MILRIDFLNDNLTFGLRLNLARISGDGSSLRPHSFDTEQAKERASERTNITDLPGIVTERD